MPQRSFSSGSRQAPDPYDQFLEQHGFYRKHTARDASSLFRVISEQMYDTQMHHFAIRKKCVSFMRKNRKHFQMLIERDLDEYLDDMSKPKTFATLIELQAVGLLYQRNVLLFEPFNLGNIFGRHGEYYNDVFRVFCTPEKHFDSVFTSSYIKDAAICQSLCYELLYKDLFKLPDVKYAVEIMLHSDIFDMRTQDMREDNMCTRIVLADNKIFDMDKSNDTNCILEDPKLCNFHSGVEIKSEPVDDAALQIVNRKPMQTLLPKKHISCVRQLLAEGITPFPYKVAKALEPTMYRNIEFDSWNEARKELKMQNWYSGDGNFKVGAKCHVRLSKTDNDLYACYIQDISIDRAHCIVYIEQLGEKRLVPYDTLTPLPIDQFKPWALPYRFHRHMQKYNSMHVARCYNYRMKASGQWSPIGFQNCCKSPYSPICHDMGRKPVGAFSGGGGNCVFDFTDVKYQQHHHYLTAAAHQHHQNNCYYNLTHLDNFRARSVEYCTMPLTVEHNVNVKCNTDAGNNDVAMSSDATTAMMPSTETPDAVVGETVGATDEPCQAENLATEESPNSMEVALVNQNYALEPPNIHYATEFPGYYPIQPYAAAMPDDYYACDPGMNPQFGGFGSGSVYYMCSPNTVPASAYSPVGSNYYQQPHPPNYVPQPVIISPTPMPPMPYYPNTYYTNPSIPTAPPLLGQGVAMGDRVQVDTTASINTPLTGRVNYDARKSLKHNGVDLPTDVPTLRYFYNLGVEYHSRRRHSQESAGISALKLTFNVPKEERNEPKDMKTENKLSTTNNNYSANTNTKTNSTSQGNSTYQNNGPKQQQQYGPRRFFGRYTNNNTRDRQQQRRNSEDAYTTAAAPNNSYGAHRAYNEYGKNKQQQQPQSSHDYNERNSDSNRSNATSNSYNSNGNRHHHSRNAARVSYSENAEHGASGDANADIAAAVKDTNTNAAGEPDERGQIQQNQGYATQQSNYDAAQPPSANIVLPLQQPSASYGAMYTAPVASAGGIMTAQANPVLGTSPGYGSQPFFGQPGPSPLMPNTFSGPTAPGFYTSSNTLSSNTSESSGGGNGGNGNGNENFGISAPPPTIMSGNYMQRGMPMYVMPNHNGNPNNGNNNGQSMMHHSLQPPMPPPPNAQGFWCMPPPPVMPTPASAQMMNNMGNHHVANNGSACNTGANNGGTAQMGARDKIHYQQSQQQQQNSKEE